MQMNGVAEIRATLATMPHPVAGSRENLIDELLGMLSDAILATQERLLSVEIKVDLLTKQVEEMIAGLTEEGNDEL